MRNMVCAALKGTFYYIHSPHGLENIVDTGQKHCMNRTREGCERRLLEMTRSWPL